MQGEELQHQWLSLSGQAALVMALRALHCITLSSASPDSSNKTADVYAHVGKQAVLQAAGARSLLVLALLFQGLRPCRVGCKARACCLHRASC